MPPGAKAAIPRIILLTVSGTTASAAGSSVRDPGPQSPDRSDGEDISPAIEPFAGTACGAGGPALDLRRRDQAREQNPSC